MNLRIAVVLSLQKNLDQQIANRSLMELNCGTYFPIAHL
jgi:hypothetical protein